MTREERIEAARKAGAELAHKHPLTPAQAEAIEAAVKLHVGERRAA